MVNDAHAAPRGTPDQTPLTAADVPAPSPAERARTLVASETTGALATLARDPAGFPYGSFVTFGLDGPDPVFLISGLAEHTKNLLEDPRASLLVVERGEGDPLARGRVTLIGKTARLEGPERQRARDAFLAVHPNAAYYEGYGDFGFWRLAVESLRWVGGYGRMSWIGGDDWRAAESDPIARAAGGILKHMNDDHGEAMLAYVHAFTRAKEASGAVMTGVDRYGFELSVTTAEGPRPVRLGFSRAVTSSSEVRTELVALAKRAREALGR